MLGGSCGWGTICKYQNRGPKALSKAFNIGEVWNLVCCLGNILGSSMVYSFHNMSTGVLILWSTSSRILLQRIRHFWYKVAEISLFIRADQNSVEFMTSSLGWFAYFKKRKSLEQKETFENSKQHSSSRAE